MTANIQDQYSIIIPLQRKSPLVYFYTFREISIIYHIVAHVEHRYTNFRRFFAIFYSALIAVIIPFVTLTKCVAVVNDPVAPTFDPVTLSLTEVVLPISKAPFTK